MQMVNQNKLQKQQQAVMENMMKMAQNPTANIPGMGGGTNIPGMDGAANVAGVGGIANVPGAKEAPNVLNDAKAAQAQVQQQTRALSKEAEAAKQKLMSLRAAKQGKVDTSSQTQQAPFVNTSSTHPSLNDAIPAKYKRLAKRGSSPKQS